VIRLRLLALPLVLAGLVPAAAAARGGAAVTLTTGPTSIHTRLGGTFVIRTSIGNPTAHPAAGLIAHLNVLSLGRGLYVDPEDWSSRRTRYLAPIPAHGSITLRFEMTAVDSGNVGIYVAVLPRGGKALAPVTGPLVRVGIADRRTLDAAGILPLAIGLPVLLGLAAFALRMARRGSWRTNGSATGAGVGRHERKSVGRG
jgi:hypothetical protein